MDSVRHLWKNEWEVKINSLIPNLVEALRGELAAAKGGRLPSLTRLCRKYDVSLPTMRKAANQLRDRGELTFSRGRTPRAPGPVPELPPRPPPTLDRIVAFVRERIATGDWPVGQALPKILALAGQFHASDHTVTTALARLEHGSVIHRRGRSRYVGPQPAARASAAHWSPPHFILIVQGAWNEWQGLCDSNRTEQFAGAFSAEAERMGIELLPVVATEKDPYVRSRRAYVAGERAILDHLKRHRDRYLGALLCGVVDTRLDAAHWHRRLLEYRRPQVLLDIGDKGPLQDIRHPLFTRCGPSESAVAACAVEALVRAGHRRVGYPYNETVAWEVRRLHLLRESVAKQRLDLTFVTGDVRLSRPLNADDTARLVERVRVLTELPPADVPATVADVMPNQWSSPWMGRLLLDPALTAIAVPNDSRARYVYEWLSALRVGLPDRFSLVSFDNYRTGKALPITSVDFGYGRLGYCAFHAILRTIPTPRDHTGAIHAQPFMAHRGSLGPAFHP